MYANITVTLRHETGRTTTITNARYARHNDNEMIVVGFLMPSVSETEIHEEEYDGLSWSIDEVSHTEIPPSER